MECSLEQFREVVSEAIIPTMHREDLRIIGKQLFTIYSRNGLPV